MKRKKIIKEIERDLMRFEVLPMQGSITRVAMQSRVDALKWVLGMLKDGKNNKEIV